MDKTITEYTLFAMSFQVFIKFYSSWDEVYFERHKVPGQTFPSSTGKVSCVANHEETFASHEKLKQTFLSDPDPFQFRDLSAAVLQTSGWNALHGAEFWRNVYDKTLGWCHVVSVLGRHKSEGFSGRFSCLRNTSVEFEFESVLRLCSKSFPHFMFIKRTN